MRFPVKAGFLIGLALVALGLLLSGQSLVPAQAQTPTLPPPAMPTMQDRLAAPPTVYPPTQADQGAQVYWLVCMVCHGDRGQGLTDEWRMVGGAQDQNCWQSKCHAPNHPPHGFVFQKYVPPVIAPGLLTRFATALDLHDFIQNNMPWQAPGSPQRRKSIGSSRLSCCEPTGITLGTRTWTPDALPQIPLRPYPPSPPTLLQRLDKTGPWAWGAALFILVGIALALC